jgi:hypothetical protein
MPVSTTLNETNMILQAPTILDRRSLLHQRSSMKNKLFVILVSFYTKIGQHWPLTAV